MIAIASGACLMVGAFFMLVAALGIVRLPDLFMRMHAAAKAPTLGMGLILLGAVLHLASAAAVVKAALIVVFLALTTPIGAHMIARAGYLTGASLWGRTRVDEYGRDRPKGEEKNPG